MVQLAWDNPGERYYETGIDRGVLYIPDGGGFYSNGVAWNGLTAVTEKPTGAEANAQYADNIKYLNLISVEEFEGTLEAFQSPVEFDQFDGTAALVAGVSVGQQTRKPFGLSYRSRKGNDLLATDFGYKIHCVYGALAAPTERAYATINDTPEAITLSWDFTTSPVAVPGFKPAALLTIDSTKLTAAKLLAIETVLYGTAGVDPRLPLPAEIQSIVGTPTTVTPTVPAYNSTTHVITIPTVTGIEYRINGVKQTNGSTVTLTTGQQVIVTANPLLGYVFGANVDDDWQYSY